MTYEDIKNFIGEIETAVDKGELNCNVIVSVAKNDTDGTYSHIAYGDNKALLALSYLTVKEVGAKIRALEKSSDKQKNKNNLN